MSLSITVGVYDWARFAADGGFYPEDLPEEWRLSYYSNEFNSACIDLAGTVVSLDELCEWTEDLPDNFELSFAIADEEHLDLIRGWLDAGDSARLHALLIQDANGNNLLQHRHLESVLSKPRQVPVPHCLAASAIWRPGHGGPLQPFALLSADSDMRSWRNQVEQWVTELENEGTVQSASLWLPGQRARFQQLADLRQMIELMGY